MKNDLEPWKPIKTDLEKWKTNLNPWKPIKTDIEPWKTNLDPSKLTWSCTRWLLGVEVVTGDCQEEVLIFRDPQTAPIIHKSPSSVISSLALLFRIPRMLALTCRWAQNPLHFQNLTFWHFTSGCQGIYYIATCQRSVIKRHSLWSNFCYDVYWQGNTGIGLGFNENLGRWAWQNLGFQNRFLFLFKRIFTMKFCKNFHVNFVKNQNRIAFTRDSCSILFWRICSSKIDCAEIKHPIKAGLVPCAILFSSSSLSWKRNSLERFHLVVLCLFCYLPLISFVWHV